MFVSKAGAYPREEPFRCSNIGWAPGHIHKPLTTAADRHSSLLQKFINYGRTKFYNIGPLLVLSFKTVYVRNLQMFIIS